MGIPSYFSYIIKNYTNIIQKFGECEKFHDLFMDCNSMIYDAYYRLEKSYEKEVCNLSSEEIEKLLINQSRRFSFHRKRLQMKRKDFKLMLGNALLLAFILMTSSTNSFKTKVHVISKCNYSL